MRELLNFDGDFQPHRWLVALFIITYLLDISYCRDRQVWHSWLWKAEECHFVALLSTDLNILFLFVLHKDQADAYLIVKDACRTSQGNCFASNFRIISVTYEYITTLFAREG